MAYVSLVLGHEDISSLSTFLLRYSRAVFLHTFAYGISCGEVPPIPVENIRRFSPPTFVVCRCALYVLVHIVRIRIIWEAGSGSRSGSALK